MNNYTEIVGMKSLPLIVSFFMCLSLFSTSPSCFGGGCELATSVQSGGASNWEHFLHSGLDITGGSYVLGILYLRQAC